MSDGEWQTAGGASGNRPEPSFEDPEGFVDDISNEELMPDIMARAPREADGIENVVIISNIPKTAKVSYLQKRSFIFFVEFFFGKSKKIIKK